MPNKILTLVIEAAGSIENVLAAAINEAHNSGNTVQQVRVTDDSGETLQPVNTIADVTVPEPVATGGESEAVAPAPSDVPVDEPVNPTPVSPDSEATEAVPDDTTTSPEPTA